MSGIDIAIIVVVAVLFAGALGYIIYRKLKGKGGCDCGGSCATCGMCKSAGSTKPESSEMSEQPTECPFCKKAEENVEK